VQNDIGSWHTMVLCLSLINLLTLSLSFAWTFFSISNYVAENCLIRAKWEHLVFDALRENFGKFFLLELKFFFKFFRDFEKNYWNKKNLFKNLGKFYNFFFSTCKFILLKVASATLLKLIASARKYFILKGKVFNLNFFIPRDENN
jgi:hypothetical protein